MLEAKLANELSLAIGPLVLVAIVSQEATKARLQLETTTKTTTIMALVWQQRPPNWAKRIRKFTCAWEEWELRIRRETRRVQIRARGDSGFGDGRRWPSWLVSLLVEVIQANEERRAEASNRWWRWWLSIEFLSTSLFFVINCKADIMSNLKTNSNWNQSIITTDTATWRRVKLETLRWMLINLPLASRLRLRFHRRHLVISRPSLARVSKFIATPPTIPVSRELQATTTTFNRNETKNSDCHKLDS